MCGVASLPLPLLLPQPDAPVTSQALATLAAATLDPPGESTGLLCSPDRQVHLRLSVEVLSPLGCCCLVASGILFGCFLEYLTGSLRGCGSEGSLALRQPHKAAGVKLVASGLVGSWGVIASCILIGWKLGCHCLCICICIGPYSFCTQGATVSLPLYTCATVNQPSQIERRVSVASGSSSEL